MQLTENIYLVGSGEFGISNDYDSHTYLIDGGSEAILIDCGVGYDSNAIFNNISKYINPKNLTKILLTHLHADHCGGTNYFSKKNISIYSPENEYNYFMHNKNEVLEAFKISQESGGYPKNKTFPEITINHLIKNHGTISVGILKIEAIELRGHSPGSMAYLLEYNRNKYLFSGDYVFAGGYIGLLNCPGSELSFYRKDMPKLKDLNINCLFPGHRMPVLKNAQNSIDKALYYLSKMQIPPTF